jgi:hypothetical protein
MSIGKIVNFMRCSPIYILAEVNKRHFNVLNLLLEIEYWAKRMHVSLRTGSQAELRACIVTNEFEYLRLKSWREILIGQML